MISFPILILRLALALVLGGLIGLEREFSEHRAGMRTNALVSLGAALFTVISAYGFLDSAHLLHVQIDPTRIASYVVAGIGFLGGGAIFTRKDSVRGLTTAAAIWTVAAIGMACGVGFYWESVLATALTLIVLHILRLAESRLIPEHIEVTLQLRLNPDRQSGALIEQIYNACVGRGLTVESLRSRQEEGEETLELRCRIAHIDVALRLLDELRTFDGVREAHVDLLDVERMARKRRDEKKTS